MTDQQAVLQARYPKGKQVTVLSRYQGSGRFAPDGYEGTWFVVKTCAPSDLCLARLPGDEWEVMVHLSRIDGDPLAGWRADQA